MGPYLIRQKMSRMRNANEHVRSSKVSQAWRRHQGDLRGLAPRPPIVVAYNNYLSRLTLESMAGLTDICHQSATTTPSS